MPDTRFFLLCSIFWMIVIPPAGMLVAITCGGLGV